ncbi:MAG: hypothetical protein V7607_5655 [Solirubrobacteraceae bacterium]
MTVHHWHWSDTLARRDLEIEVAASTSHTEMGAHDHDFLEIVLIVGGSAIHETLYGRRPIGGGDAFVIRPGAWHGYAACEQLSLVNCAFKPELLERELLWLAEEPRLRFLLWPGEGDGLVALKLSAEAVAACRAAMNSPTRRARSSARSGSAAC